MKYFKRLNSVINSWTFRVYWSKVPGMTVDKIKCEICDEEFEPKKYSRTRTCSKICQSKFAVQTRKEKGSYDHNRFTKEKIRSGVNRANAPLLHANIPIEKYRNADSAKLKFNSNGVLVAKECTICKQVLQLDKFRKTSHVKHSKTGFVSMCRPCEISSKTTRRRAHGVKPMFIAKHTVDANGNIIEKECSKCHIILPASKYTKSKLGRWNLTSICIDCQAAYSVMRKYGVSSETKRLTYEKQNGCCAICKTPKKINEIFIDHDHTAEHGKGFRGLLCNFCNWAYGVMGDGNDKTPDILQGMLDYYMKTRLV